MAFSTLAVSSLKEDCVFSLKQKKNLGTRKTLKVLLEVGKTTCGSFVTSKPHTLRIEKINEVIIQQKNKWDRSRKRKTRGCVTVRIPPSAKRLGILLTNQMNRRYDMSRSDNFAVCSSFEFLSEKANDKIFIHTGFPVKSAMVIPVEKPANAKVYPDMSFGLKDGFNIIVEDSEPNAVIRITFQAV